MTAVLLIGFPFVSHLYYEEIPFGNNLMISSFLPGWEVRSSRTGKAGDVLPPWQRV